MASLWSLNGVWYLRKYWLAGAVVRRFSKFVVQIWILCLITCVSNCIQVICNTNGGTEKQRNVRHPEYFDIRKQSILLVQIYLNHVNVFVSSFRYGKEDKQSKFLQIKLRHLKTYIFTSEYNIHIYDIVHTVWYILANLCCCLSSFILSLCIQQARSDLFAARLAKMLWKNTTTTILWANHNRLSSNSLSGTQILKRVYMDSYVCKCIYVCILLYLYIICAFGCMHLLTFSYFVNTEISG